MADPINWSFEVKRENASRTANEQAGLWRRLTRDVRMRARNLRRLLDRIAAGADLAARDPRLVGQLEEHAEEAMRLGESLYAIRQPLARGEVDWPENLSPAQEWKFLEELTHDDWVNSVQELGTEIAGIIDRVTRDFPSRGRILPGLAVPPPGWPGHDPGVAETVEDYRRGVQELRTLLDAESPELVAEAYASSMARAMAQQVNEREAYAIASTESRRAALIGISMSFAIALDVLWPMQGRLERGDVGRYVLTEDLLSVVVNSKEVRAPDPDDSEAMQEWIRDTLVPYPIVVVRVPALQVAVEAGEESGRPDVVHVFPADADVPGALPIPESDLFITTVGTIARSVEPYLAPEREHAAFREWMDEYPPSTTVVGQVTVRSAGEGYPATMLNSMVALVPEDDGRAINYVSYIGAAGSEASPDLLAFAASLVTIWRQIALTLLMWWNDPRAQIMRRIGQRRVIPDPMTEPTARRRKKRKVVRYEVLGENLRWDPEVETPPGMRSSPVLRSFVRGHWAAWPRMSERDPILQAALDCLPELDPSFLPEDAEHLDLVSFQGALQNCIGLMDVNVRHRKSDYMDRLMCTLLRLGTSPMSPLAGSPLWQRDPITLRDEARAMCRLRRTWKWPHWRGPEEGDEVLAVTFLRPE